MESSANITQPTKLHALVLKLRPLERGTLMPFSGELVHGAWLNWLRDAAPDVAQQLHEGNKRRLFTCSSLHFPLTYDHIIQAQRESTHLPLDPQKSYSIRLTFLHGELFALFYTIIMDKHERTQRTNPQPFMQIGKQAFLLEEVVSHSDDPSGWSSFTTCETLVEQAKAQTLLRSQPLQMEFTSLTTFNWIYPPNKRHGSHYARLPLPSYVFGGLASRWHEIAPPALRYLVQRERIAAYIETEGIIIDDYQLQTHSVHFAQHTQPGFIGTCRYLLRCPDDAPTAEERFTLRQQIARETGIEHSAEIDTLTVRQQILLLSQLAFYTGVGYKTTMGMGQTRAAY